MNKRRYFICRLGLCCSSPSIHFNPPDVPHSTATTCRNEGRKVRIIHVPFVNSVQVPNHVRTSSPEPFQGVGGPPVVMSP
jgi:hypothetical protein